MPDEEWPHLRVTQEQIARAPQGAYLAARNASHLTVLKRLCKAAGRNDLKLLNADQTDWRALLEGQQGVRVVLAHTVWLRASDIPMLQEFKASGVAEFTK